MGRKNSEYCRYTDDVLDDAAVTTATSTAATASNSITTTSMSTTQEPELEIVNNPDGTLLGVCEGECDNDDNCAV